MGVLQQKRRWIRCGLLGRGCAFFGKMDGSRCPRRDAAQCSSIAVSGLLADGAWHSRSAPAAPARPHPGPGQPFARALNCLYLVVLPWRDVVLGGAGHLGMRGAAFALGVTSPAPPVGCGDQGAPCSTDAGQSCWPSDAEGSLMLRRDSTEGRGCKDSPGCGAFGVELPLFCASPINHSHKPAGH